MEGALACQQFLKGIIYEFRIYGIYAAAREVAPDPRDDAQFCVGHALYRVLLVLRREVEVLLGGHHDGPSFYGREGFFVTPVEAGRPAYVAVLPSPEHGEEVVGIAVIEEETLPEADEEVLQGRESQLLIHPVPVKSL